MLGLGGASGQTLVNGADQAGTLSSNTVDSYVFNANTGDNIVLRLGTTGFDGNLQLNGPTGAVLKTAASGTDAELTFTATNSGMFTALVSSYYAGGSGTYVLHLAQFPESYVVPAGDEGGPMTNGTANPGTITLGDLDMWSFTAGTGDNIVLRLGTTGFDGNLRLYGPNGALLQTAASGADAELTFTATNSGTFTALVSSYFSGGIGTYMLHLAQFPEPFVVSPGEQGGAMTNGGNFAGTNNLGDLNMWSFSANSGDNIVLRLGTTNYDGNLRLYGPNGVLLKSSVNGTDAELTFTATNSGTFTALISSYYSGGIGTYMLHLAQFPESFIVPAGDDGGPITNGTANPGTITLGDLDMWSFTANAGDNLVLRLGTTGFDGYLRLYGPNGALLNSSVNGTDAELTFTATNSGTFTALVSSYYSGGIGTYMLHLAQFPEPFVVSPGEQGGAMTNGGNFAGTNNLGDLDLWSFTANAGDNLVLRLGTVGYVGFVRLYGPNGALLKSSVNGTDAELTFTATNSGTFTALVNSYPSGGTGTYVLHLAQFPEPYIVPPGDDGGPITNGTANPGTITLGDLDMWSFTANAGDNLVLRLGTTGFDGNLRLYGPNGALLQTAASGADAELTFTATNSGTFTALVSSYFSGGIGTYMLHLAQFPEAFVVSPGEQGGPLSGSTQYYGTITLGDLDIWSFTACIGDAISVRLNTTNFNGDINLYGPTGVLLKTASSGNSTLLNYTITNCGTFSLLVGSYFSGGTGTYGLTASNLAYQTKLCLPLIKGANLTLAAVGGMTNAAYILYSTTNVAIPFESWAPLVTNAFDKFGVFNYTNTYNAASPRQEYFRFLQE